MKKNLLFVLGLVAMLVMVAGCGDDEEDANFVDDFCAKVFECKDTIGLDEETFTASFGADEAACVTKNTPAETEPVEGEEAPAEADTTCQEACIKGACEDLLTCLGACAGTTDDDDDNTDDDDDDDDDDDVDGCADDSECDLWMACLDDGTGVMACEASCGDDYVEGTFGNNNCAGTYEMVTARYGKCQPVPCTADADCAGLGACDKTPSTAAFICDTAEGSCKRQ